MLTHRVTAEEKPDSQYPVHFLLFLCPNHPPLPPNSSFPTCPSPTCPSSPPPVPPLPAPFLSQECLVLKSQPAGLDMLHGQVIDTLGVLARTVGQEHFMPLAQECLQLGMVCVCVRVCVRVNECVVLSPCPLLYMKNGMQSEEPDLRGAV